MKQFEVYKANIQELGSEVGTTVIILQNNITDDMDAVICAPITNKESKNDTHIKANIKDGKTIYIMTERMRNIEKYRLKGKLGELSEEDYQNVNEKIMEMMK